MLANFYIALHDWFIGLPPRLVGLDNFTDALNDRRFWNGVRNTFYFTGLAVPIQLVLGMAVALLFGREVPAKGLIRTIILLPIVATPVAIDLVCALMLHPRLCVLNACRTSHRLSCTDW